MTTDHEPQHIEIDNAWYAKYHVGGPYVEIWHREACQAIEALHIEDDTDRTLEYAEKRVRAYLADTADDLVNNVVVHSLGCP